MRHTSGPPYPEALWRAARCANYRAAEHVARRENFIGSNFFGANVRIAGREVYVVYSFRTPILAWVKVGRREYLWVNDCTHSPYTSRHRDAALGRAYYMHGRTFTAEQWHARRAFGHNGARGDSVYYDLADRIAKVHGVIAMTRAA